MAAKTKKQSKAPPKKAEKHSRLWIGALVCLGLSILSIIACVDSESLFTGLWMKLVRGLFGGTGFFILPFSLFLCGAILLTHGGRPVCFRLVSASILVLLVGAFVHLMSADDLSFSKEIVKGLWGLGIKTAGGGFVTGLFAMGLTFCVGKVFSAILLIVTSLVFLLSSLNMTVPSIVKAIENRPKAEKKQKQRQEPAEVIVNHVAQKHIDRVQQKGKKDIRQFDLPVDDPKQETEKAPQLSIPEEAPKIAVPETVPEEPEVRPEPQPSPETVAMVEEFAEHLPQKVKPEEAKESALEIARQISSQDSETAQYTAPTLDLLAPPTSASIDGTAEMRENAKRLDETLKSFNIDAHIVNVTRGPSITRYELELDKGVKLSKVTGLADDIALSLGASGVRISAVPNKISVVGVEVPNKLVSMVYAREVIGSDAFYRAKSRLAFAVGKDIGGTCIVGDVGKLPHLLIAGTTGSGKSVCMNSLIISLLYKSTPDEVKLIMIDPKMVELGIYNGIPHLLIPVVTDPKKAAGSLQWAVTEMMRRYHIMAEAGVRNLEEFNKAAAEEKEFEPMPRIVVVIDELADLMLVAAKDVEEAICRVAQMGRAAGIHLIVATQRPSADVITGLMKANIPSRIAFAVASAIESRIILDTVGAEKLVGKGDMLYAPLGEGKPRRIQGCFITDEEVQRVVSFIKSQKLTVSQEEQEEILNQIDSRADNRETGEGAPMESEEDELLPAAVEVFLESGQGTVSMLQRRLRLGYVRAARIVDEMEERGIVGPLDGTKPRQVLITREEWAAMSGQPVPQTPAEEPEEE